MTDIVCGYRGDRDETLVAYLYDDINAIERARFETHLIACERCRGEIDELRASQLAQVPVVAKAAGGGSGSTLRDDEMVRRLQTLIQESERRQQRELALRVADVMRDVTSQRAADLVRVEQSLGLIQNNTGVELLKQRQQLNYLVRTSQRQ